MYIDTQKSDPCEDWEGGKFETVWFYVFNYISKNNEYLDQTTSTSNVRNFSNHFLKKNGDFCSAQYCVEVGSRMKEDFQVLSLCENWAYILTFSFLPINVCSTTFLFYDRFLPLSACGPRTLLSLQALIPWETLSLLGDLASLYKLGLMPPQCHCTIHAPTNFILLFQFYSLILF